MAVLQHAGHIGEVLEQERPIETDLRTQIGDLSHGIARYRMEDHEDQARHEPDQHERRGDPPMA